MLVGVIALSVSSLVVGNVAMIAAPTPAYAASKKSGKESKDPLKGIKVQSSVEDYSWDELANISDAMTRSGSEKAALKIAKKYKLCSKKGKLDGSQTKQISLRDAKSTVMIVGFYHDDLADGSGKAGITWQFADPLYAGSAAYAARVADFGIFPSDVQDNLATVTKKTVYADGVASGEATTEDVKLWAPAADEVFGEYKRDDVDEAFEKNQLMVPALNAEGTQYDYYKDAGMVWEKAGAKASDTKADCPYELVFRKASGDLTLDEAVQQGKISLDLFDRPTTQNGSGYRSIYFDAEKDTTKTDKSGSNKDTQYMLASMAQKAYSASMVAANNSANALPSSVDEYNPRETAVYPMFCLSASAAKADSDSDESSNGVTIQATVDDYSWKDLKTIADEIAAAQDDNAALDIAKKYHLVDDNGNLDGTAFKTVKLKDGTVSRAYIAGFNHDDRADGKGKAGITFLFGGESLFKSVMVKDGGDECGWENTDLRKSLDKKVLDNLPKDLKKSIVKVNKITNNIGETSDPSSVTTTEDSIWLPSLTELYGKEDLEKQLNRVDNRIDSYRSDSYDVYEAEGTPYLFWHRTTETAWTRTSSAYNGSSFMTIKGTKPYKAEMSWDKYGIYPGFCL